MSKIKSILAFAAALVCGGAWAASGDVLASWSDNLSNNATITTGGVTYTMSGDATDMTNSHTVFNADGTVKLAAVSGTAASKGLIVSFPDGTENTISVLVKYYGYAKPNGWNTLLAAMYKNGTTDTECVVVNPNNLGQVNAKFGVTSSSAPAEGTSATQKVYDGGYLLATFDAPNKKVMISIANSDGEFQSPVEFSNDTANYWPTTGYKGIKVGGSIVAANNTYRPAMTIGGVTIFSGKVTASDVASQIAADSVRMVTNAGRLNNPSGSVNEGQGNYTLKKFGLHENPEMGLYNGDLVKIRSISIPYKTQDANNTATHHIVLNNVASQEKVATMVHGGSLVATYNFETPVEITVGAEDVTLLGVNESGVETTFRAEVYDHQTTGQIARWRAVKLDNTDNWGAKYKILLEKKSSANASSSLLYNFHLDGNHNSDGTMGMKNVTLGSSMSYSDTNKSGGKSLSINSSNSGIKVLDENGLSSFENGWTVSLWVNRNSNGNWGDYGAVYIGDQYYKLENCGGSWGNNIAIYAKDSTIHAAYEKKTDGTGGIILTGTSDWNHIALVSCVQDGKNGFKVYLNGEEYYTYLPLEGKELRGEATQFDGLTGINIGPAGLSTQSCDSMIDEVAVFSKSLTAGQIADLAATAHVTSDVIKVAEIDGIRYDSLDDAITAANAVASEDHEVTITLTKDCSEDAELGEFVTLDPNGKSYTGTLTGSGTYILTYSNNSSQMTQPPNGVLEDSWTGTVWVVGNGNQTNINDFYKPNTSGKASYSHAGSKLAMTGLDGYFNCFAGGTVAAKEVKLFDNGSTKAFVVSDGTGSNGFLIKKLTGTGTLADRNSGPESRGISIEDASEFEGNIDVSNRMSVRLGTSSVGSGTAKTIDVYGIALLADGKTWTAPSGITVKSTGTIKGSGTLVNATTFESGATIDVSKGTLTASSTVTFGAAIKLVGTLNEGDTILSVATEPTALALTTVTTVNGEAVPNAHLYYEDGAVKYSCAARAAAWEPNEEFVDENQKIFDWSATGAWKDASGQPATWSVAADDQNKPDVVIDATKVKGVVITGQVYVGNVKVTGTLGDGESFQFHNHLKVVDNDHEVNPNGVGHDCLHAANVDLTGLVGELGMKVPITGNIAFGAETHLVFATGTGATSSTAYGYSFIDRGGSIAVEGDGRFVVPSSMYSVPFAVGNGATIVFDVANGEATSSAVISGSGSVVKKGAGTIKFTTANTFTGGLYVEAGEVKTSNGVGYGPNNYDNNKPMSKITVSSGATLDLANLSGTSYDITCSGTLKNSGGDLGTGTRQTPKLTMSGNVTVNGNQFGLLANSWGATSFDMGGNTLTVSLNQNKKFILCNTTITNPGLIDVTSNTIELYSTKGNLKIDASTVTFPNGVDEKDFIRYPEGTTASKDNMEFTNNDSLYYELKAVGNCIKICRPVSEMTATALNASGTMRIAGNATLNVDTDITGTPSIVNASGSAVTLTLKAVAPKTYVSAADIKKLQLGTNITLAYDWKPGKIISMNFGSDRSNATMSGDTVDGTLGGSVPRSSWNNLSGGTGTKNVTVGYNTEGEGSTFEVSGMSLAITCRGTYDSQISGGCTVPFMHGYIDDSNDNSTPNTFTLSGIPFSKYDVVVYFQCDTANATQKFGAVQINDSTNYGYNDAGEVVTVDGSTYKWGVSKQANFSYENNTIRIVNQKGGTLKIAPLRPTSDQRSTIAAIQIIDSSDQTVANPTGQYRPDTGAVGCFSGWGDSTADNNKTVGPFGVGVIQRLSSTWHPYKGINLATMGENNEFTLGLYANIEQVKPAAGKHAVLWSMGDFWNAGNRYILAKESNGDVKLYLSETEKLTIPASAIGSGYHLFTMVFSATSGTKLILDNHLDAIYEDTELKGVQAGGGFQVGQGYGTNPTDFVTGTDMGVAVVIAYQVALNAEQLEEYVLRYPVSTTFSVNVDVDTNNQVVYMPTMSALAATYIGGSKGTLTIPEGATVSVPSICTINNNNSGDRFTMNIAGTVEVTSTTANAVIYGQHKSKGILFGHYHGQGTYNITGTLNAPNTGIETVYTAEMQTIELNGGTINTKAFYAQKLDNTTINLSNGATINLSLEDANNNVPFTNVSDANKIAATGSMAFSQAITLTAGTLEFDVAEGKTVTISGAVSGEGKILKKVNGKGELVFTGDVASGIVADVTGLLPGEEYVVAKGAFNAETVAKCEAAGGEGWSVVNRGTHIAVRHQIATVGETPCYTIVDIATAVAAGGTTITITSDSLVFSNGSFVLNGTPVEGISATDNGDGTYQVVVTYEGADEHNLVISEICPKLSAWDENHKDAGWLELHNTGSTWVNFGEYTLGRYNRGKAVKATEWTNGVTLSIAPGARLVVKTSEDYSAKSKKTIVQYGEDLGNAIVFDSKVNPKKYPLVVLIKGGKVIQKCVVPVDVPENKSVCYDGELKNGAIASYITTASKGEASNFEGAVAVGPQISPLYAVKDAVDPWQKFPKATIGEDYAITVPVNPIMDGNAKNEIASVQLIYRLDFGAEVVVETPMTKSETKDAKNGYTYTGEIPGSAITTAGQLVRWAVKITDVGGNEWRSPSFNNGDDGYEYFGTIVTPSEEQLSGGLNTWHLFADPDEVADGIGTANKNPNALMNKDADESGFKTTRHPNGGRVGIYDMETGLYYDNVRIDKRGRTTGAFTKKAHGLKFSKSQPFTGTDSLTGEKIECRKSSITAEYGDPTFIRQELAFEVLRRNGVKVPFHYPVRLNLNGQFYQLAFHSERFSDELIEDFYGLDGKGYAYKNVGTFHNGTNNSSERKTPDDGSPDLTINDPVLRAFCDTLNGVNNIGENTDFAANPTYSADVSKVVTRSFDLPAWLNYIAATKITAETDDSWANLSGYYDINGTGTWMPLAYDMNQSLGQWHFADDRARGRIGLVADKDDFKSHPFYGGLHIRMHNNAGNASGNPNYAYEAIFQSEKFRRLFLRRLRTLMDKEIGATVYADQASEKSALFTSAAQMVAAINELGLKDRSIWTDYANVNFDTNADCSGNGSADKIWVWNQEMTENLRTPEGGLADLWTNYVKPRRAYLYGKHLASNGEVAVGYGLNLSAGIPAAQTDIATLKGTDENPKITARYDATLGTVIIENDNEETIDLSGWKLTGPVTMTIPEGTVLDQKVGEVKGQVYFTANRKVTIEAFGANLADQIVVGNGAANGAETPISLRTPEGMRIFGEPTAQELNIRFDAFYGSTLGDGDENEWFSIKNIGEEAVEYTGMTVCILKDGDGEEKDHCHVTLPEGTLEAGASKKFAKGDFAAGFVKIQNNVVNISVYDMYMSPVQKMQVTQKDYTWAYQHGAYLEHQTDSGKWHQVWDSGDLVLADYLSDKGKNVKALAKDLYVRASAPMTITLDNPSFDKSATLKISGEGKVTITGTLNATVNTTAIKSSGNLIFADGSYTITAGDDCIQADGDITINGGTFICHSTGNDGIDANQDIVINGGTIFAFTAANEALEGEDPQYSTGLDVNTGHTITINGGTIIATSATSAALEKLTLAGSQAAKIVEVEGVSGQTKAIGDVLVTFPVVEPTAVLVSKPGMTSDSTVVVEEEAPGTVEIVAEDAETDTPAVHATVPASWKSHAAVTTGTITEKQAAEAFVLGLAEPTEKPMVSSEQTTEADSIRIVDNVAPRFGTGVTVKRTLFVGTTPGEEAADESIKETNGGFTVPLPTGSEPKVKYIKIKYSFK